MKLYMDEGYDPDSLIMNTIYRDEINSAYKKIRDSVAKTKNPTEAQEKKLKEGFVQYITDKVLKKEAFPHCRTDVYAADIAPSQGMGSNLSFVKALDTFRIKGVYLNGRNHESPTLLRGEGGGSGEKAHHLLFTGLKP